MKEYDIVGFGSSVLDITLEVEDEFLEKNNLKKGNFLPIDDEKSKKFDELLKNKVTILTPGGSASNIIAGASILGAKTAFIGGIGNDEFGKDYENKTKELGIDNLLIKKEGEGTGKCIAFITPDKERTFAVNIGSSNCIKHDEINLDFKAKIIVIEGYKLADQEGYEVAEKICEFAKENKTLLALDVNDAGIIEQMGEKIKNFIKKNVDILFMNEIESKALTGFDDENAFEIAKEYCDFIVLKIGEKGSIVYKNGETFRIDAIKTSNLVNTNGAGDSYAAAFLYGLIKEKSVCESAELASAFASKIVAEESARINSLPDDIKELLN